MVSQKEEKILEAVIGIGNMLKDIMVGMLELEKECCCFIKTIKKGLSNNIETLDSLQLYLMAEIERIKKI